MARRSKKDDGAAGAILIIGGVILAAVAAFLSIVVIIGQYLFSVGFFICVLMLLVRRKPEIKSAQELCSRDEVARLSELQASLDEIANKTNETFASADRAGLLRRSNEQERFDERKPLAKRINAMLDLLEQDYVSTAGEIDDLSANVQQRYFEWSEAARRWKFWSSGGAAFFAGFSAYLLVLGIFQLVHPAWLDEVSDFVFKYSFLNAPSASGSYGTKIVGFLVATPVTLLVWPIRLAQLEVPRPGEANFRALWYSSFDEPEVDDEVTEGNEPVGDEDDEPRPQPSNAPVQNQAWWTILGVSADASVEQIKTAYRTQIQQYHPDKVATLGPKLKDVAEEQTRLLNSAYKEGLAQAKPTDTKVDPSPRTRAKAREPEDKGFVSPWSHSADLGSVATSTASASVVRIDDTKCSCRIPYNDLFTLAKQAGASVGGKLKAEDLKAGTIRFKFKYGINPFGIRVDVKLARVTDESVEVVVKAKVGDLFDTFGAARARGLEVFEEFIKRAGAFVELGAATA